MMTLLEYLQRKNITGKDFAARVKTDPATISRLMAGKSKPRIDLALRIEKASRGHVKVSIWASGADQ